MYTPHRSILVVVAIVAFSATHPAAGADIKYTFAREFPMATDREKSGADLVVKNSGGLIPIEHFQEALVLSTRWFSRRGTPDIFYRVQGNRLDHPSLCIVQSLEDESLQYAGCVSIEGKTFYKRLKHPSDIPDLLTVLNGRKHRYTWNGNQYSD
jgi:hypothetical protein